MDWYSSKGVQLTYVELPGVGGIDLYSTHLHSGGDLPTDNLALSLVIGSVEQPSEAEKQAVRIEQLREIATFKNDHGDPSHVAILTGDFNISAGDTESYRQLVQALNGADFAVTWDEVWSKQYVGTAFGATTDGEPGTQIPNICTCGSTFTSTAEKTCLEPQSTKGGSRIDYLLIKRATEQHTFTVDACVLRRLPFLREPRPIKIRHRGKGSGLGGGPARTETYDPTVSLPFASDHLGLMARLLCAPSE